MIKRLFVNFNRFLLISLFSLFLASPAFAVINLTSPSNTWVPVLMGNDFDPAFDQQSASAVDMFGTSVSPHYYMKYDDAGTSNDTSDDEVAFRFRVVQTGGSLFDGNIWVGLDVDSDNDIDAFMMLNSQNSSANLDIYDTGLSVNTSPDTTSSNAGSLTPVTDGFEFNYTLTGTVDQIFRRRRVGAQTYYVSYKIKVDSLVNVINQQTLTNLTPITNISSLYSNTGFINSSAFQLVVASGQSATVLNGDFTGYNDQLDDLSDRYKSEDAFSGSLSFSNPQPINAYTQTTLITANASTIIADGISTANIIVQLKDNSGANINSGGVNVALATTLGSLSNVTDNLDGTYSATLTSSLTSGTATISGTLNGSAISDVETITFFASSVEADVTTSLIDSNPASIIADGITTSVITVQLKDSDGNNLNQGGDVVTLNTSLGSLSNVMDNNDGTYTANLTSVMTTGSATITGVLNGIIIVDGTTVEFVSGAASTTTSTLVSGALALIADGVSSTTVTVQLKDNNGNNLNRGGDTVSLNTDLGNLSAVIDNANGTYSATLTSSVAVGIATITGSVNGSVLDATQTVTFTTGNASVATSTVSTTPTSIAADGVSVSSVLVQLIDDNGNMLTTGGDNLLISTTLGSISVVTDNNDGSYSAILTSSTTAGLALITATLNGSVIVDNAAVSFVANPADNTASIITAIPGLITADGISTTVITVQLKDSASVNLVAGGDSVILSATLGSLSAVIDNNDGTYSATLTSVTTTGLSTITGSVNSAAMTSTVIVTFAAGIADANVSELSADVLSIDADGVSTSAITVQLKDVNGNNLIIGGDSVMLSTTAGVLSAVVDLENGSYRATLTSDTTPVTATVSGVINGSVMSDVVNVVFVSTVTLDTDNDGVTNDIDIDDDNDGVLDIDEGNGVIDSDNDGIVDSLDLDTDGDGLYDLVESAGIDADNNGLVDGFSDANADGYDDALTITPLMLIDTDRDGIVNRVDLDSDNDGVSDVVESAGIDENGDGLIGPAMPTVDVNGVYIDGALVLIDTDNDGVFNPHDLDSDNDGIPDVLEAGGDDAEADGVLGVGVPSVDANGLVNGIILITINTDGTDLIDPYDLDADDDELFDLVEAGGNDSDNDGMVDGFVDDNNDGFDDFIMLNPLPIPDSDFDGIPDYQDNNDIDNDGIADALDIDDDNDGIPDDLEGSGLTDTDGDGIADSLDLDSDNDGIFDLMESGIVDVQALDINNDGRIDSVNTVGVNGLADIVETFADSGIINYNNGVVIDSDSDGIPNYLDLDSDNDSIVDVIEAGGIDPDGDGIIGTGNPVVNNNGLANGSGQPVLDTDNDGIPNYLDLDSDNDGITDLVEAGRPDVNSDGVIDNFIDDNRNGLGDTVEGAPLPIIDSDADGIPDYLDDVTNINTGVINATPVKTGVRGSGALNMWIVIMMMPFIVIFRCYQACRRVFIFICLIFLLMILASPSSANGESQDDYNKRIYAGFMIGQSTLSPDTTGTAYSIFEDKDSASKFLLGIDVTENISTEISASDLGAVTFNSAGEIDYSVIAISALYYWHGQSMRDHTGWGSYVKTGLSAIKNDATILFEQENSVQILFGAGIRYGWNNGLSARIELESYDKDASLLSAGLIYRFGKTKQIIMVDPMNDADNDGVDNALDQCPATLGGRLVDKTGCEFDGDGDGVIDSADECPYTPIGLIVEPNGCL